VPVDEPSRVWRLLGAVAHQPRSVTFRVQGWMDVLLGELHLRRRVDRRGNLVGHEGVVHEKRRVGPGGRSE
jgi:hypothetical protein